MVWCLVGWTMNPSVPDSKPSDGSVFDSTFLPIFALYNIYNISVASISITFGVSSLKIFAGSSAQTKK